MELNKIYNEDCLEGMKHIPDGSVDCIICDLPYGMTANKWDAIIPFEELWDAYKRVCKPNSAIVLFGSQPFTSAIVMSNPKWFKHEWIWQKNRGGNFGTAKFGPAREHENILVFSNGTLPYHPQMQQRAEGGRSRVQHTLRFGSPSTNYSGSLRKRVGNYELSELRRPSSVQYFVTSCGADHFHPTQKPVALLEYLVKTYSNEGDVVLDNCMGSGTTAVACIRNNRNYIGFELNKEYYDKSLERIQHELNNKQFSQF